MTREGKARWLSDMYAAMAEGKTLQYRWVDVGEDSGPGMGSDPEYWRIKPGPVGCVRLVEWLDEDVVGGNWVKIPDHWPKGTKVRVTEILE